MALIPINSVVSSLSSKQKKGRRDRISTSDNAQPVPCRLPRFWRAVHRDNPRADWPSFAIGVLTEVDMAAFAAYCQSYARWKEAEEFITEHGTLVRTPSGYWQQVPQVSIAQTYMKQMGKFATEFGLTPASRSRLIADAGKPTPGDEMEELLGGDP